jgi:hypothetical protein
MREEADVFADGGREVNVETLAALPWGTAPTLVVPSTCQCDVLASWDLPGSSCR